jgi:hypothetical protein
MGNDRIRNQAAELQLRIRGLSFDAIGKQLGCSQQIAFKVYGKALRAILPLTNYTVSRPSTLPICGSRFGRG